MENEGDAEEWVHRFEAYFGEDTSIGEIRSEELEDFFELVLTAGYRKGRRHVAEEQRVRTEKATTSLKSRSEAVHRAMQENLPTGMTNTRDRNRYAGTCVDCGGSVQVHQGYLDPYVNHTLRREVHHHPGQCRVRNQSVTTDASHPSVKGVRFVFRDVSRGGSLPPGEYVIRDVQLSHDSYDSMWKFEVEGYFEPDDRSAAGPW